MSFVITSFCKDGIAIGSDSRGNLLLPDGRQIAYFDRVQKIFPIGNNILAYTGSETISNIWFSAIVWKFIAEIGLKSNIDTLIEDFIKFCTSILPPHCVELVKGNKLVAAGFLGDVPKIYFMDKPSGVATAGYRLVQSDQSLMNDYREKLLSLSFVETNSLIKESIETYSKKGNHIDIGGPIVIRNIRLNGSQWYSAPPVQNDRWLYYHHFTEDYMAGKVQLHLCENVTQSELNQFIKIADEWSRNTSKG